MPPEYITKGEYKELRGEYNEKLFKLRKITGVVSILVTITIVIMML